MRALAFKELREILGITVVALGAYLALVISLMGGKVFDWVPGMPGGTHEVRFVGGEFTTFYTYVSLGFALALGFRQSAWELGKDTYLFLLHRPVSRNAIFLTKIAVGGGTLLVCSTLPIVLYGWWAATPGHHASPFAWSMTMSAWQIDLAMPLLYLGSFLSGLRPARWFGTRLLPLVAAGAFVFIFANSSFWWLLSTALCLILSVLLVANVCYVARVRDYA
ncbi:MAG TPA: hypothetical protein VK395_31740 [Gemmataceae bacterium]|nr:hypothetical protein [Gemmataceae bacterium]